MVFVEGSNRFYDYTAFIQQGRSHMSPDDGSLIPSRNLNHDAPYWPDAPDSINVPMDCVGTITLVPTWIYLQGARYEDHPAFTDHYSICKACRDAGKNVVVCRDLIAQHADLPKYGEQWH